MPFDDPIFEGVKAAVQRDMVQTPQPTLHIDEQARLIFARAIKDKLEASRGKGRGGWETPECTQLHLSQLLRESVEKGDPVDVAIYCMFLFMRNESIT